MWRAAGERRCRLVAALPAVPFRPSVQFFLGRERRRLQAASSATRQQQRGCRWLFVDSGYPRTVQRLLRGGQPVPHPANCFYVAARVTIRCYAATLNLCTMLASAQTSLKVAARPAASRRSERAHALTVRASAREEQAKSFILPRRDILAGAASLAATVRCLG